MRELQNLLELDRHKLQALHEQVRVLTTQINRIAQAPTELTPVLATEESKPTIEIEEPTPVRLLTHQVWLAQPTPNTQTQDSDVRMLTHASNVGHTILHTQVGQGTLVAQVDTAAPAILDTQTGNAGQNQADHEPARPYTQTQVASDAGQDALAPEAPATPDTAICTLEHSDATFPSESTYTPNIDPHHPKNLVVIEAVATALTDPENVIDVVEAASEEASNIESEEVSLECAPAMELKPAVLEYKVLAVDPEETTDALIVPAAAVPENGSAPVVEVMTELGLAVFAQEQMQVITSEKDKDDDIRSLLLSSILLNMPPQMSRLAKRLTAAKFESEFANMQDYQLLIHRLKSIKTDVVNVERWLYLIARSYGASDLSDDVVLREVLQLNSAHNQERAWIDGILSSDVKMSAISDDLDDPVFGERRLNALNRAAAYFGASQYHRRGYEAPAEPEAPVPPAYKAPVGILAEAAPTPVIEFVEAPARLIEASAPLVEPEAEVEHVITIVEAIDIETALAIETVVASVPVIEFEAPALVNAVDLVIEALAPVIEPVIEPEAAEWVRIRKAVETASAIGAKSVIELAVQEGTQTPAVTEAEPVDSAIAIEAPVPVIAAVCEDLAAPAYEVEAAAEAAVEAEWDQLMCKLIAIVRRELGRSDESRDVVVVQQKMPADVEDREKFVSNAIDGLMHVAAKHQALVEVLTVEREASVKAVLDGLIENTAQIDNLLEASEKQRVDVVGLTDLMVEAAKQQSNVEGKRDKAVKDLVQAVAKQENAISRITTDCENILKLTNADLTNNKTALDKLMQSTADQHNDVNTSINSVTQDFISKTQDCIDDFSKVASSLSTLVSMSNKAKEAASQAEGAMRNAGKWLSWKWVTLAAGGMAGVCLVAYGGLVWQLNEVGELRTEREFLVADIAEMKDSVAALAAKGGRIVMTTCGGRLCIQASSDQGPGAEQWKGANWSNNNKPSGVQLVIPRNY